MKTKLKLLFFIPTLFFVYSLSAQNNPTHQAYINFYVDEMEKMVDAVGFVQLREQMIAETELNEKEYLTKEQYYKQLALLKIMLKKEPNNFVTTQELLNEEYDVYVSRKIKSNERKKQLWKEDPTNDTFLYASVEQIPTFPRCKKQKDNLKRKKCLSNDMSNHIKDKYDYFAATKVLRESGIIPKGEKNDLIFKTFVKFRVTEVGDVIYLGGISIHEELDRIGARSLVGLPKLEPAIINGATRSFIYTIPVSIQVAANR
jgi:protein TonB